MTNILKILYPPWRADKKNAFKIISLIEELSPESNLFFDSQGRPKTKTFGNLNK